jgi:hypothetical protein
MYWELEKFGADVFQDSQQKMSSVGVYEVVKIKLVRLALRKA